MKKIDKLVPRLAMTTIGVILCSLAVGFFKESLFGVDPFQCFAQGVWGKFFDGSVSYGLYYTIISLIMLVIVFFLDKHYINIATFINMFLTGYIVDFSRWAISKTIIEPGLVVRVAMLLFGIVLMCFASSLYMTSDLGVSVYDAIAIIISNKTKWQFRFCRIGSDIICVIIGAICGLLPGLGTLITAFFMGPLIEFFNRHFSKPLLSKFK